MKQAISELNWTFVVITAVALLSVLFFFVVWPMTKQNFKSTSMCSNAICDIGFNKNGMAYCYTPDDESNVFECPYRG